MSATSVQNKLPLALYVIIPFQSSETKETSFIINMFLTF